jgi:hypothetical protein
VLGTICTVTIYAPYQKIIAYEQGSEGLAGLSTAQNKVHHHLLSINAALHQFAYSAAASIQVDIVYYFHIFSELHVQ